MSISMLLGVQHTTCTGSTMLKLGIQGESSDWCYAAPISGSLSKARLTRTCWFSISRGPIEQNFRVSAQDRRASVELPLTRPRHTSFHTKSCLAIVHSRGGSNGVLTSELFRGRPIDGAGVHPRNALVLAPAVRQRVDIRARLHGGRSRGDAGGHDADVRAHPLSAGS